MALGIWSRFQSLIFGGAIGAAASEAIAPALEPARQHAWQQNQVRILDPTTLAALVAQGAIDIDAAGAVAARNGFDADKTRALVHLELKAPPYAETLDLWRRNATRPADEQISETQVDHALAKAQIEHQYWPALKELINSRLSAPEIALGIVRGLIADPGILPVAPPTEVGKVPAFPQFNINALAEAASSGFDKERLSVYVGTMGRPMAVNEAARAAFREIIERVDFDRAIAEGDIRNEWRDALFEVAREIPTAHDGIEDHLRGWVDAAGMYATTARHGMSQKDTDLLFRITGRPLSFHQVFIGLRRGGSYNGPIDQIDPAFLKSLRESNIRPEWYNLAWAQRYSYESPFVLRQLTEAGDLTQPQAESDLLDIGWRPDRAKQVSEKWAATSPAKQDPAIKTAETKFLTALHKAFVGGAITDAQGVTEIALTSLSAAAQAGVLGYWRKEKALEAIPPPPVV